MRKLLLLASVAVLAGIANPAVTTGAVISQASASVPALSEGGIAFLVAMIGLVALRSLRGA